MLNKLIKKITAYFCNNGIIVKEDAEIYEYGLFILLSTALELASVLIVSIIVNKFFAAAVFLLSFLLLRGIAGGYHASTAGRCYLILLAVFAAYIVSLCLPLPFVSAAIVISIVSAIIVFRYAPVDNENKRLSEQKAKKEKRLSIVIVSAETLAVIILSFSKNEAAYYVAYGQLAVAASLLAVKIKEKRNLKCQKK